jgi:hypothetical protein
LWNYEANRDYSNGIAGLGRDGVTGLNQKQGSSSEEADLLTISVGNFSDLNKNNAYLLKEGDFLIWGHNDAALAFDGLNTTSEPLLERRWLLQSTNTAKKPLPTVVKFRLPEKEEKDTFTYIYYLAIDRSGTGNFGTEAVEYFAHSRLDTAGCVYFDDVAWDTDGSGTDMFTFSCRKVEKTEELAEAEEAVEEDLISHNQRKADGKNTFSEEGEASYRLYPNPTSGQYRLEADLPNAAAIYVRMYTLQGSILSEWKSDGKAQYSYEGYMTIQGNYIIEVETVFGKKQFHLSVVR